MLGPLPRWCLSEADLGVAWTLAHSAVACLLLTCMSFLVLGVKPRAHGLLDPPAVKAYRDKTEKRRKGSKIHTQWEEADASHISPSCCLGPPPSSCSRSPLSPPSPISSKSARREVAHKRRRSRSGLIASRRSADLHREQHRRERNPRAVACTRPPPPPARVWLDFRAAEPESRRRYAIYSPSSGDINLVGAGATRELSFPIHARRIVL